jgi:hypothetical protein
MSKPGEHAADSGESDRWRDVGIVKLNDTDHLVFSRVSSVPGIYRFTKVAHANRICQITGGCTVARRKLAVTGAGRRRVR